MDLTSLGIDGKFLVIQTVGFIIMVVVLAKYAFGPMVAMLQQRQDTIQGNFDEAEARRNEMVKLQREYEDRLAKIEDEARDKIQVAVREAQAARDEIMTRAKSEAETVIERGKIDMAQQQAQAMVTMRNQLADLTVQAASRVVKENLNTTSHAKLIDDAIADLGLAGTGLAASTRGSAA